MDLKNWVHEAVVFIKTQPKQKGYIGYETEDYTILLMLQKSSTDRYNFQLEKITCEEVFPYKSHCKRLAYNKDMTESQIVEYIKAKQFPYFE